MVFPSGEIAQKRIHNGLVCAVTAMVISIAAIKASFLEIFIF